MSESGILLTVVIPAYNYASTLRRAVMSVANQLNDGNELIVIDDGSTDETPSVISRLSEELPSGIRFIRKENGGLSSVRNRGLREARGDYLVFLDADDELLPDALLKLKAHIHERPETRMIIGGHISAWPDGKTRGHLPKRLPQTALKRVRGYLLEKEIVLCNGACAMHKEIFLRANYPESFRSAEDIPVFAQALANHQCTTLRETIAVIHKHDDSLRHRFAHAKAGGLALVEEVFSIRRLGAEFQHLKSPYIVQRCLSLFRSAYLAKDYSSAKSFYQTALKRDWMVLLKMPYTKKALRLFFRSGGECE